MKQGLPTARHGSTALMRPPTNSPSDLYPYRRTRGINIRRVLARAIAENSAAVPGPSEGIIQMYYLPVFF